MSPRLVVIAGPLEGQEFALDRELSIGRAHPSTIIVEDNEVSRNHCVILPMETGFVIRDLGSRNGTHVNGLRIGERILQESDEIRIGNSVFRFVRGQHKPDSQATVELRGGSLSSTATVLLRREDSVYLAPEKLIDAVPRADRSLRNLQTLLKISAALRSIRDPDELQAQLLDLILGAIPAARGVILLANDAGEIVATQHRSRSEKAGPMSVSRTVVDRVLQERVAMLTNDVLVDNRLHASESLIIASISSLLAVPVVVFDRVLGVIYLDTTDNRVKFDEDHLQLLAGIAGVAAPALDNALRFRVLETENCRLQAEINVRHNMIGESPRLRAVYEFIAKAAPSNSTVLIRGESGTGKELVARAIHRNSPRAAKPFVAINCAALTETLLESELFGHEKGAFTGAVTLKRGRLEEAEGGSVFLDEVGELAASLQAKLLRVLQEREFQRVGGTRTIKADIRLIAATNRDLEAAVREGAFRRDLYYRLDVVSVALPPLRDRKEDITLLAQYFAAKHAETAGRPMRRLSPEARACLLAYDWPGNVRELENAIERAVVLGAADTILVEDLPDSLVETAHSAGAPCTGFHAALKEAKKQIVLQALERAEGNYSEAAKSLGLDPSNLHRLIRNLDLRAASKRP